MYKILSCCIFLALHSHTLAQFKLSQPIQRGLNNYISHGNQAVHVANVLHKNFVQINIHLNQYLEKQIPPPPIPNYYPLLDIDALAPLPDQIYHDILEDNIYLPQDKIQSALLYANQTRKVLIEIDSLHEALTQYLNTQQFLQDTLLTRAFADLQRAEVLYYDLFELQEKNQWALNSLAASYERVNINDSFVYSIQRLQPALSQARKICRTIRSTNHPKSLPQECADLKNLLDDLQTDKNPYIYNLPTTSAIRPEQLHSLFVQQGYAFTAQCLSTLSDTSRQNLALPPQYYYYNFYAFPLFNRYGDGLTGLYNSYIQLSGEYFLYAVELPLVLSIDYPNHPHYTQPPIPPPNPQDSLRQDSLQKAKILTQQLNSLPTHNLVLLLDVSVSMQTDNKLKILQSSLINFSKFLRPNDRVTIVTYDTKAKIFMPPTSGLQKDTIANTLQRLSIGGTSDFFGGLQQAYSAAQQAFIPNGNNQIIFITDGQIDKINRRNKKAITKQTKNNITVNILYIDTQPKAGIVSNLQQLNQITKGQFLYTPLNQITPTLFQLIQNQ